MARVTVQLVTWNSESYVRSFLASLAQQSDRDFDVTVVDNASRDATVSLIEAHAPPHVRLLRNTRNLGFARAHNMGFRLTKSPYVLVANPDVIFTPTFLASLLPAIDRRPDVASAGGKLLRYQIAPGELREVELSATIDSTGLVPRRSRRFVNRGEGERDQGQYDAAGPVFGHSGSLVLYRREALLDVADGNEVFDESFFAYYEDVDLAWRLQWRGWSSWYEPRALAYHRREIQAAGSSRALLAAHRSRSLMINTLSYKNAHLLLVKNEHFMNAVLAGPWILARSVAMFCGYALTRPRVLASLFRVLRELPGALRKRSLTMRSRKRSAAELRSWF